MFNHRRQSRDRVLVEDLLSTVGKDRLWMGEYSVPLFSEYESICSVSEDFLSLAAKEEWCFLEDRSPLPYLDRIESILIYRWNRRYPSDLRFEVDLKKEGFTMIEQTEFVGYSHEKITKEIYRR